jgi:rare lipoprotein A
MRNNDLAENWGWPAVALAALVALTPTPGRSDDVDRKLAAEQGLKNTPEAREAERRKHHVPDYTARKRVGKASFYAKQFAGRKMADGAPMDPHGINAASKTLPLGTTAKLTNLETGQSAVVKIQDRGPYVPGRIVDLSPATAKRIGITRQKGVATVVVAPIAVPQPDGRIRLGAAAREPLDADAPQPVQRERSFSSSYTMANR